MLKRIIAPIQVWLLAHGQCVGCGRLLGQGKRLKSKTGDVLVRCACGRSYIAVKDNTYRRALLSEV